MEPISDENKTFLGVKLSKNWKHKDNIVFYNASDAKVIVALKASRNATIYLLVKRETLTGEESEEEERNTQSYFDHDPSREEVTQEIQKYRSSLSSLPRFSGYLRVIFPMIDLAVSETLKWSYGLQILPTDGSAPYIVTASVQTINLNLNERGLGIFAIKSDSKLMKEAKEWNDVDETASTLCVDAPFLMWIETERIAPTLFEGYMTENYWKKVEAPQTFQK